MKSKLKSILKEHWLFILISIGFFVFYAMFSLVDHYNFRTNAYDLGIFNQTLYHYAHFDLGPNTLRHVPTLLGDHFELIMFLLAPLYWIFGSYTLLIVQILAVHFGALGVYLFIKHQSKDKWLGLSGALLFYGFFGVINALSYDYHNNVVGIMFLPWLFYMLSLRKIRVYYLFLALFLISKENLPLISAFLGLSILIFEKKELKKHGLITFLVSVFYFFLVLKLIIPSLNQGEYDHWAYASLGSGPMEAIKTILTHPIQSIQLLFDEQLKRDTWRLILLSGGILTIFRPKYLLLMIPIVAQKFFSGNPAHWGHTFQYSVEFAPIIAIGATLAIAFVKFKPLRYGTMIVLLGLNVYLFKGMKFYDTTGLRHYFTSNYYQLDYDRQDLINAMKLIPNDASVSAQNSLVPHLTNRDEIYLVSQGSQDTSIAVSNDKKQADYILLNVNDPNVWPLENTEALLEKKEEIENRPNYKLIYESGGVFLYERK